ncbi:MAG: AbrB/MazE/SpoVT family DNA-binding domain-containing protein [Gemmatimonadaceae bacterium]
MPRRPRKPVEYAKVSVKSQTVLPRAVREALAIRPGDTVRFRFTERGVVIDKALPEADDPFAAFSEWKGRADDDAYGGL